ncbi:zinc/iron-chelating domain-containing protein [Desulfonatronum parangueonense]
MVDTCFPISLEEQTRLAPHAQRLGIQGHSWSPNTEFFLHSLHKLFPGERERIQVLFPEGERHCRLAIKNDGSCLFLGTNGCILPRKDRPFYCRLYPFWFINTKLFTFSSRQCLAVNRVSSTTGLCALFKTDPSALRTLYEMLRTSWGLPADEKRYISCAKNCSL